MEPATRKAMIRIGVAGAALGMGMRYMVGMPGRSFRGPLPPLTSEQRSLSVSLEHHVKRLAGEIGERNMFNLHALRAAAEYIRAELQQQGWTVQAHTYAVEGRPCDNLAVEMPGTTNAGEIVLIGAHYDSVLGSPGANDNASGVAALLELARHFAGRPTGRTLRFVAFVNEEPPFFWTHRMGSRVYARACRARGERIAAMLSLETIGFYSDEKGSQRYPFPLGLFYPHTGDFIAFVGNLSSRRLVRRAIATFRARVPFPSEGAAVPGWIPGVGWSDHWSFWKEGYPAIMVTDTAPYRYPHYHAGTDTPNHVDYDRLARVTLGLIPVIEDLAEAQR